MNFFDNKDVLFTTQEKQLHQQSLDTLGKFEYDLKSRLFYLYQLQNWD